jgi:hypothetical protein
MTEAEANIGDHQGAPLAEHIDSYISHLEAKGACPEHRAERKRQLHRLAAECSFATLADLRRETLERWVNAQTRHGMGRERETAIHVPRWRSAIGLSR